MSGSTHVCRGQFKARGLFPHPTKETQPGSPFWHCSRILPRLCRMLVLGPFRGLLVSPTFRGTFPHLFCPDFFFLRELVTPQIDAITSITTAYNTFMDHSGEKLTLIINPRFTPRMPHNK